MVLAKMKLMKYRKYKAGIIIYQKISSWYLMRKV